MGLPVGGRGGGAYMRPSYDSRMVFTFGNLGRVSNFPLIVTGFFILIRIFTSVSSLLMRVVFHGKHE